jgi:hypothetical protein
MKGGALTGNQIFDLYVYGFSNESDKFKKIAIDNIKPLDVTDTDLYNDKCRVFYIDNSSYKSDLYKVYNIRFIIVHQGTGPQLRDLGNNVRNLMMGRFNNKGIIYDKLTTSRNLKARRGHERLKTWIRELFLKHNNKHENNDYDAIIKTMENIMNSYIKEFDDSMPGDGGSDKYNAFNNIIDELLLNTLTTVGHSQGAVYAYLYGNQGKETIVINPAPSNNKKPDNTYIIKIKGDPVSILTTYDNNIAQNRIIELDKRNGATHKVTALKGLIEPFGNQFLYNKEPDLHEKTKLKSHTNKSLKSPSNSNSTKSSTSPSNSNSTKSSTSPSNIDTTMANT